MNTKSLSSQLIGARAAYWAMLVAVHSVFLAVAFTLMSTGGKWGGDVSVVFAWCATMGLLMPVANGASYLSQVQELWSNRVTGKEHGAFAKWIIDKRSTIWSWFEIGSTIMLLICVFIILWFMSVAS